MAPHLAQVTSLTEALDLSARDVSLWAQAHGLTPALHVIEVVFEPRLLTLYAALAAVVLLRLGAGRVAALPLLATLGAKDLTGFLKGVFERERPPWQTDAHTLDTASFPSSHAAVTTALAVSTVLTVAWLARRHGWPPLALWTAQVLGAGATLVVLADRVLLGRHYPTDVLAGAVVGTVIALAAAALLGARDERATGTPVEAPTAAPTDASSTPPTAGTSTPVTAPAGAGRGSVAVGR